MNGKKLQEFAITGMFGAWITSLVAGVGISPMVFFQDKVDLFPAFAFSLIVALISTFALMAMAYFYNSDNSRG
mgnify:FL=1